MPETNEFKTRGEAKVERNMQKRTDGKRHNHRQKGTERGA